MVWVTESGRLGLAHRSSTTLTHPSRRTDSGSTRFGTREMKKPILDRRNRGKTCRRCSTSWLTCRTSAIDRPFFTRRLKVSAASRTDHHSRKQTRSWRPASATPTRREFVRDREARRRSSSLKENPSRRSTIVSFVSSTDRKPIRSGLIYPSGRPPRSEPKVLASKGEPRSCRRFWASFRRPLIPSGSSRSP